MICNLIILCISYIISSSNQFYSTPLPTRIVNPYKKRNNNSILRYDLSEKNSSSICDRVINQKMPSKIINLYIKITKTNIITN